MSCPLDIVSGLSGAASSLNTRRTVRPAGGECSFAHRQRPSLVRNSPPTLANAAWPLARLVVSQPAPAKRAGAATPKQHEANGERATTLLTRLASELASKKRGQIRSSLSLLATLTNSLLLLLLLLLEFCLATGGGRALSSWLVGRAIRRRAHSLACLRRQPASQRATRAARFGRAGQAAPGEPERPQPKQRSSVRPPARLQWPLKAKPARPIAGARSFAAGSGAD